MNKFDISEVLRDDSTFPYDKKCDVCKVDVSSLGKKYWVDSDCWWGHKVCCSEECSNMLVLQSMDAKPLTGYDYMSKSIQEGIDRQIIDDLMKKIKM